MKYQSPLTFIQRLTNVLTVLAIIFPIACIFNIIGNWETINLLAASFTTIVGTILTYLFVAGTSFLFGGGYRIWNQHPSGEG